MSSKKNEIEKGDPATGEVTKALAVVQAEPVNALAAYDAVDTMKAAITLRKEQRVMIDEFIDEFFEEDVDFGYTDDRSKKKSLMKAGAEKVASLFNSRLEWVKDDDVWEMLGRAEGIVCMKCLIVDRVTGAILGEGRGAEKVGNKGRDANKAIKNAEKCAAVDAALWTFNLSARFTQDMEGKRSNEATKLAVAKEALWEMVKGVRQGKGYEMTDNRFAIAVIGQEFNGRKTIQTPGEATTVMKAINAGKYDMATAKMVEGKKQSSRQKAPPQVAEDGEVIPEDI